MQRAPATTSLLRQINRSAIIQFVRSEGVVSPSGVADRLKISLPTVTRVLNDLVEEGLAAYDGFAESPRGRPRARVQFKGDTHAIIGIEATGTAFYGAVSDLDGSIQTELTAPVSSSGKSNAERLIRLIRDLKKARRPRRQRIIGIGVGVPSIVRHPDGVVVLTLGLGWNDLPLKKFSPTRSTNRCSWKTAAILVRSASGALALGGERTASSALRSVREPAPAW